MKRAKDTGSGEADWTSIFWMSKFWEFSGVQEYLKLISFSEKIREGVMKLPSMEVVNRFVDFQSVPTWL
jgi:hypothetical protein